MIEFACVASNASGSVQYSLEPVSCASQNSVTIIHPRCYKGMDQCRRRFGVERPSDASELAQPVKYKHVAQIFETCSSTLKSDDSVTPYLNSVSTLPCKTLRLFCGNFNDDKQQSRHLKIFNKIIWLQQAIKFADILYAVL